MCFLPRFRTSPVLRQAVGTSEHLQTQTWAAALVFASLRFSSFASAPCCNPPRGLRRTPFIPQEEISSVHHSLKDRPSLTVPLPYRTSRNAGHTGTYEVRSRASTRRSTTAHPAGSRRSSLQVDACTSPAPRSGAACLEPVLACRPATQPDPGDRNSQRVLPSPAPDRAGV